ncbi:flagellar basal body P-ring formation chaperone FlgA [Buchnera aphidicola]|uniref:flagellar basal body P-ring formation chaperone FlgA n=1 Tax=Buchnera aphidicola TaxID=9 RepID=UPI00313EBB5B
MLFKFFFLLLLEIFKIFFLPISNIENNKNFFLKEKNILYSSNILSKNFFVNRIKNKNNLKDFFNNLKISKKKIFLKKKKNKSFFLKKKKNKSFPLKKKKNKSFPLKKKKNQSFPLKKKKNKSFPLKKKKNQSFPLKKKKNKSFPLKKKKNKSFPLKKKKNQSFPLKKKKNKSFPLKKKKNQSFPLKKKKNKSFPLKKKKNKSFLKQKNINHNSTLHKYFVASKFLKSGTIVSKSDITKKYLNIKHTIATSILDIKKILNKKLKQKMSIYEPFSYQNLESVWLIKSGDIVPIMIHGKGFIIKIFGKSLQNSKINQETKVMFNKKKILYGKLRKDKKIYIFL